MNTGHEGSLTTVHANSPRDALSRIENMVLMSGYELPSLAIREQMASAFHLVMQLSRYADGSRRVTGVSEVVGMEGGTVTMQDLFTYEISHIEPDGRLIGEMNPTGIMPTFAERFTKAGIPLETIVPSIGSWS
jgi:pilus assembly protein CpaF